MRSVRKGVKHRQTWKEHEKLICFKQLARQQQLETLSVTRSKIIDGVPELKKDVTCMALIAPALGLVYCKFIISLLVLQVMLSLCTKSELSNFAHSKGRMSS